MKKSSKLFSFLAVLLCAFMLFGSVGSFQRPEIVVQADASTYEKVVSFDTIKNLKPSASDNYYVEYGEYPQSGFTTAENTSLRSIMKDSYGATYPQSSVDEINESRTSENSNFTYDESTGYFTATRDIKLSDNTTIKKGEKIYEYISGVNAREKYPVYAMTSATDYSGNDKSNSLRSAKVHTELDSVSSGTYYGTAYTKCTCSYCDGDCPTSTTVYTGSKGSKSSRTLTTGMTMPAVSSSKMQPSSSSWLRNNSYSISMTFDDVTGIRRTDIAGVYYTFHNGSLVPYEWDGNNHKYATNSGGTRGEQHEGGVFQHLGGDREVAAKLYSLVKEELGCTDKQIYQIELVSVHDDAQQVIGFADRGDYTVRAYVMKDSNSCAYCATNHNKGKSPVKFTEKQYAYGDNAYLSHNNISSGVAYYFKVEPIKWRIIENNDGILTLQSTLILDSMYYNLYTSNGTNFMQSYLRNWLNNGSDGFKGYYNVVDLNSSATGRNESINVNAYRYTISGHNTTYNKSKVLFQNDISGNISALGSKTQEYESDKPSFFTMAFSNLSDTDKGLMTTFTEAHDGLMAGFNGTEMKITPGSAESDKNPGRIYSKNYVIIPNSVTNPVSNTTDAIRLEAENNKVYTDFAAATGLVSKYSDAITQYTTTTAKTSSLSYSSQNGTNALLWLSGGYSAVKEATRGTEGITNFKTLAVAYSSDEGVQDSINYIPQGTIKQLKDETPFNRMDQSAGVLPIIKLDMTKYGSSHYFKQVKETEADRTSVSTAVVISADGVSLDQGSYLETIALQSTVNDKLKIHSYEYQNETSLTINFTASTSWDDNVDYIRISIGSQDEGTNVVGDAVFAKAVRYYAISPSQLKEATNQLYTHYVTLTNIDLDNLKLGNSTTNNANLGNETLRSENLRVYVSLVTDNETKEYAIEENQIKFASVTITSINEEEGSTSTPGTVKLYEGQIHTITASQMGENTGVFSNWYWDTDCKNVAITAWLEGEGSNKTAKDQRLWYDRTKGWHATEKGDYDENTEKYKTEEISLGSASTTSIQLYCQTQLGKYNVNIGGTTDKKVAENGSFVNNNDIPQRASDVMYINYAGSVGTYSPIEQDNNNYNLIKTATENVLGGRVGDDSKLTFQVYIKGIYANQFTTIDDLLVTSTETTSTTMKGILSFTTYNENEAENTSLSGTPTIDNGWTYAMASGVMIKVSEPVKNYLPGSAIVDSVLYNITVSGVQATNVYTKDGHDGGVALTLMLHAYNTTDSNETVVSLANLTQDTFTMKMVGKFEKTDLHSVTTSTENTEVNGKPIASYNADGEDVSLETTTNKVVYSQESKGTIEYNTKLTADIKFKTGYSLATNAFTQNGVTLPTMSLGYATQVMDDNGYRMSEDQKYGKTGNSYAGSNIRLDALGRQLDFDENDNLVMYYQTSDLQGNKSETIETTYKSGCYLGDSQDYQFAYAPLISLHRESAYLGHQIILFIPKIVAGGTTKYFDEYTGSGNTKLPEDYEIVYSIANFEGEATDGTSDVYQLVSKWHLVESKEELLEKYANDNLTDEESFTIAATTDDTDYLGRSAGVMDRWLVYKNGAVIAGLTMSRAQAETEKHKYQASGDNYTSLYIDAEYLYYNFTTDSQSFYARLVNTSNYEIDYTATRAQTVNQGFVDVEFSSPTLSLTPISSSVTYYEPWNIYVESTLNSSATKTAGDDYTLYTVTTGSKSPLWGQEERQYFISNAGGNAQILNTNGKGYPVAKIKGVTYIVYTDDSGAYKLYNDNGDGTPNTSNPATGVDTYIVSYAQPVTVSLYEVKKDGVLSSLTSTNTTVSYAKGDTFIRIEINNVVSDVLFTFQENTISEHQYPVRFYSTFGQGAGKYQNFGTSYAWNNEANAMELFNTSITTGSTISALSGVLKEDVDSLSTTDTAEDGTLIFKPYVVPNAENNNTHYYYLAPIADVAGHNNEGLVAEQGTDGVFIIKNGNGTQTLTRVNEYKYTLNDGDTYYFTPYAYQFVGWKWNGVTSGGTANSGDGYLDMSTMYESNTSGSPIVDFEHASYLTSNNSDDDKEEYITTDELQRIIFKFKTSANELHFVAVYKPLDLNVTFNSWNMTEDSSNDGMYDVIAHEQAKADAMAKDEENGDKGVYKNTLSQLFTGNSVKGVQYNTSMNWADGSSVREKLEEIIEGYTFNNQKATYYGNDKGWYRQVPSAVSYVENTILGQTLLTFTSIDAVREAIEAKLYKSVTLWDNRQFYKNTADTLYFTINHYEDGYVAEVYEKIDLSSYKFTDNTNIYRIYETASKTVTSGFDTDKFMSSNIPTSVTVGQDLNMQFRLGVAYSDALKGTNGTAEDAPKKVTEFVKSLTINATTRYNLGDNNHTISVDASKLIESITENGDYYWAIAYTGTGEDRVDYAYVTISADCRTITITILGVIDEVFVSANYELSKNRASVTFLNPQYDNDGHQLTDGKGNVSYGVFVIIDPTGTIDPVTITFASGGTENFTIDGVQINIDYDEDNGYKQAVVTFDHGFNLYFTFTRNAAFSNYLTNNRPFAVYAGEEAVGTFSNTSFDAENSEVVYRYQQDDSVEEQSNFLMMGVTRALTLRWTDITINTYKLNGNVDSSNNTDFYTATLDTTHTDSSTGKNVAIYNETLDIVFELKEAYSSFVPTLMVGSPRDLVVFAHRYPYKSDGSVFAQGDSQVVYYNSSETTTVTLKRIAGTADKDEHFAYEFTDNGRTRYYRVYFNAETEGAYAGYYKVTWANDSTQTENILGYIKYDELNSKYMFKNVDTQADISATLSSHYKEDGILKMWSSQYKNTYSITLDKNFVANDAYTVTLSKVTNSSNDWPDATTSITSSETKITIPELETDDSSVQLVNFDHGTKVRFRVKMNSAYTQTLPNLQFLIAQKLSKILDGSNKLGEKLVAELTELFTMPLNISVNDPTATERKRSKAFTIGNLEIQVTQIFTYDTSFDSWGEFVEEAGIRNLVDGYDLNEYLRYLTATYVIDVEMKDSFTLSNSETSSYTQNQYYIIFNKYTESDGADYGPLKFVSQIPTDTEKYKKGNQYFYYQVVSHNEIANNPFTDGGTAPDGYTPISADTFKSSEVEGFTYNGADGENAKFKVKNSAGNYVNYTFGSVTGHAVLYAPFVEEEYNLRLNVPGKTSNANYEKYGEMYYLAVGQSNFGSALTSTSTSDSTVKYSKTTFSVKYQMYSAYDNSEPTFVVSHYGELKYTNAGSFQNVITIDGQSKTIDFTVSKVEETNKVTYIYYVNGDKVAKVVKDMSTYSNATNRNYVLSTTYVLTLEKAIDAGESISVDGSDTTLSVSVNINKGTNSDSATGLNTYNVTLYKPEFDEVEYKHYESTTKEVTFTGDKPKRYLYKDWTTGEYPISSSVWSNSKTYSVLHGSTLTLPTDAQDTNYFAFDTVNGYVCNGWYTETASATQTPTLSGPGARLTGVAKNYHLYAKYKELTSDINPYLDPKYAQYDSDYSSLYEASSSSGSAKYYSSEGSEVKVTFTLGEAFNQNKNLTFVVDYSNGEPTAIITGIAFDEIQGMYTLTLNYVISDVNITASTEPSDIAYNRYNISFHTYEYTSEYDSVNGWTQTIEEDGYEVWNSGNIIENIGHGEKLKEKIYNTITLTAPEHEGLTNSKNRWAYVIRGAEEWESFKESKFQDVVLATLDDFDEATLNSDGWLFEDADGNEYQVGLFTLDTEIVGNMVVFPYYSRTIYNVKVVERIESFETGEGVGADNRVSDDYYGTFRLPYGYPVLSEAVETYDANTYYDLFAIDDFARGNIGVTSQSHYTFLGYYTPNAPYLVDNEEVYRSGLETIIVSEDTTEIVIDYYRNRYSVSFATSLYDQSPLVTFEMPYGSAITDDTLIDGMPFSIFLTTNYSFANTANGRHLESWETTSTSNNFDSEDCTIDKIVCNVTFYPNVAPNRYKVRVQGDEGFTAELSQSAVHIGDTIPSKDSNGFFALDADNQLTIEYIATVGYEAHPYLVFTLSREGQETQTYNDTYWMAKSGNVTFTSESVDGGRVKWTITFNGSYDHSVLRHGDNIIISVNQTSSALAVDTTRSNFGDIIVDNGITPITFTYKEGDLVTPGNSVVRGAYVYSAQQTPVVEFLYESVAYGTDFTFIVRINSKYAKGSAFKFTLSAGEGNTSAFELDQAHIDNNASSNDYSQYKFTLSEIKENVVVTIDTTSTFVANEFKITYYHAFGGGVNGWIVNEVSSVVITKDTIVSVKPGTGSHASSPTAIDNYTLLSSSWLVLGNAEKGIYNGHLGVNLTGYTEKELREAFTILFNVQTYHYQADISVYAFYLVDQHDVTPEQSGDGKGSFNLPGNAVDGKYKADKKVDSMTDAKGYTFSYVVNAKYSKNDAIISVVKSASGTDLIILDINKLVDGETYSVEKSATVTYQVVKTTDYDCDYKYQKATNALGSTAEASVYYVKFADGVYTVYQGDGHSQGNAVATATLAGTTYTVTLATVNENFSLAVNDEMFKINAYTVKFTNTDGTSKTVSANHGTKLTDIPTAEASFIQKVVYVVTYADGTTDKLSSKEIAELEITQDMDIEIKVELNLILLIPMVVGALILVVVIVVAIAKGSRNSGIKRISGKSNMEAFEKLNQRSQATDTSKKSDKPYNPYIDNSKK